MNKKLIILIVIIFLTAGLLSAQESEGVRIGLCAARPSENPKLFAIWQTSGAKIAWWQIKLSDLISQDGKLDIAGSEITSDIQALASAGGSLVLSISTSGIEDADKFGNAFSQLSKQLKGKVAYYQIDADSSDAKAVDQYFKILKAAYKAAQDTDQNAKILNDGIDAGAIFAYRTNELIKQGKQQEAIDMLADTSDEEGLKTYLSENKDKIDFVDKLFKSGHKYVDALQVDIYEGYLEIEDILIYIKSKAKQFGFADKPIVMRAGWDIVTRDRSKNELPKKISMAFAQGVSKIIWYHLQNINKKPTGIMAFAPGGMPVARPSFSALQLAAQKLGDFSKAERLDLDDGAYAVKFSKDSGEVYVLWSQEEKQVKLPVYKKQIKITNINSRERIELTEAGVAHLDLSPNPIFVEPQD